MSGSSGQTCFPTGYFKSFTHYIQPLVSKMVSPAARPCGSKGWTLNFSMRDHAGTGDDAAGQKIARIPRSMAYTGRRLLENSDCSVLFKDCRGLLLLRTDEWHSKLQTHASEGGVTPSRCHCMKSDSTVRCCFTTACYCTSIYVILVAVALQFGLRGSSDGMGPSQVVCDTVGGQFT